MMPALGPTLPRPTTAPPAGATPPPSGADAFALILSGAVSEAAPDAEAPATPPDDATAEGGAGELPSLVVAGGGVAVAPAERLATESPSPTGGGLGRGPDVGRGGAVGSDALPPRGGGSSAHQAGVSLGPETPQRSVSTVSAPEGGAASADFPSALSDGPDQPTPRSGAEDAEPVRQEPGRPSDLPPAHGSAPLVVEAVPTAGGAASPASDSPRPATTGQAETTKTGRGGSVLDRPSYATTSPVTAPPAEQVETPPRPPAPSPADDAPSRPTLTAPTPPAQGRGGVAGALPVASAEASGTASSSEAPQVARAEGGGAEAAPRPAAPAAAPAATTPEGGAAVSTTTAPVLRHAVVETTRTDGPPAQAGAPAAPDEPDAETAAPPRPMRAEGREAAAPPRPDRTPARPDAERAAGFAAPETRTASADALDVTAPGPGGVGTEPDPVAAPPEPPPNTETRPPSADVRPTAPDGPKETTRTAPPARLAAPTWLSRLATAERSQSVQVALGGGDGTVHLQTRREGEGVSVSLRFSDPELQALASAHVGRLRDALDAHFAEPVRLVLTDGADARGSDARGGAGQPPSRDPSRPSPSGRARAADPAPIATPPRPSADGRREWIG